MSDQAKTEAPGNTPLVKIDDIYFKCEYKNPTGSHKDRATFGQIAQLKKNGIKKAVISSSGNAAISAANYCKLESIELTAFVPSNINENKLQILESFGCKVIKTPKPIRDSIKFSKEFNAYNLRQSKDPNAASGYESTAAEIIKVVTPDAVFIPVSSGTTLVGVATGFKKKNSPVQIHAVQTDAIHPIAGLFDQNFKETSEKSLADAIVAKYTPREAEVVGIIKQSGGSGWVISNSEMKLGRQWLVSHNLDCSYEGAAALAAFWKAKKEGWKLENPVCLLTGRFY